jgi:hypothetical protein
VKFFDEGLPEKIKIGSIPWTIEYNAEDLVTEDGDEADGICYGAERRIAIDSSVGPLEHTHCTLWHELLHALECHYGLTVFYGDEGHRQLDLLATGLNDLLHQNPGLFSRWN